MFCHQWPGARDPTAPAAFAIDLVRLRSDLAPPISPKRPTGLHPGGSHPPGQAHCCTSSGTACSLALSQNLGPVACPDDEAIRWLRSTSFVLLISPARASTGSMPTSSACPGHAWDQEVFAAFHRATGKNCFCIHPWLSGQLPCCIVHGEFSLSM